MFFCRWLLLITFLMSLGSVSSAADQLTYKVGIVPQFDAREIYKIWRPILDHVEKDTGIRLELEGAPTIPEFEKQFIAGEFDFAYMNPYHILVAREHQGYIPLVRDVGRTLHGILVVRKESRIKSPEELDGKTVSFPAPNALGASLMIRADLAENFQSEVIPSYVKTHSSVYLNVLMGLAEAGGGVQKTLKQQSKEIQDGLKVLYRTKDVSPHPFVVHPRVPENVGKSVAGAMLALGKTDGGQKLLLKIPISTIGVASFEDYKPLANMGLDKYYVK